MFGKKEDEDDDENSDMEYVNTDDPAIRRLRWLKKVINLYILIIYIIII